MEVNQNNLLGDNIVNVNSAVAGRILDDEAKNVILEMIQEKTTTNVELHYNSGDRESLEYANQVKELIAQQNLTTSSIQHLTAILKDGEVLYGQGIQRSNKDDSVIQFYIGYRQSK